MPADDPPRSSIGSILGKTAGFALAVFLWVILSFFFGIKGGELSGLRPGGWNLQYLPVQVGAVVGGPITGSLVTLSFLGRGRSYWRGLGYATLATPVIAFFVFALSYRLWPAQ